jgi:septal ring factor EnvC (AmiA/AmiB activator)
MAEDSAVGTQDASSAQHQATTPKLWEDSQVKEIIVARDDQKKARREAEAERDKFRLDAEQKAAALGKYQADLEAERKRSETLDAEQKKLRESLISEITDEGLKEIATKESLSLDALMKLTKRQPTAPSSDRRPTKAPESDYEEQIKPRPGEAAHVYAERVKDLRRSKQ